VNNFNESAYHSAAEILELRRFGQVGQEETVGSNDTAEVEEAGNDPARHEAKGEALLLSMPRLSPSAVIGMIPVAIASSAAVPIARGHKPK